MSHLLQPRARSLALVSCLLASTATQPLLAQSVVADEENDPLRTSDDGDITVIEEGVLDVVGATPITIDSNNDVEIEEEGTVQADDADGRAGVVIQTGTNFTFSNAGELLVTEDFVAEDDDNNGIVDEPIAEASNRYGIRVLPGGEATGTIENSGLIRVEGLASYGLSIESDFTGDIENSGDIIVIGDDSIAVSTGSIDGDLTLGGSIQSVGEGAQTVLIDGVIDGTFTINGSLANASSFVDDDGFSKRLSRSDLREDGPAVEVRGDVTGGILIDARPFDLDPDVDDEDGDGVDDIEEPTGRIGTNNESPALLIGSGDDITIGTVEGRDGTASLVVDGSVVSSAAFSSFDSTAIVIGGQGGSVDLPGGISVSGSVTATSVDSTAIAILINEDTTVTELNNSGVIDASLSSSGEGEVFAVQDLSGTLVTVNNSGFITAGGSNEDITAALDLSNTTEDVTITQFLNSVDAETRADLEEDEDYDFDNPVIFQRITGDILTSSGDDLIDIQTGQVIGDAYLGDGDDTVLLADDADYRGDIYSGLGAFTLRLSDNSSFDGMVDAAGQNASVLITDSAIYSGTFENAGNLVVEVAGGTLEAPEGDTLVFDELIVGADGTLAITVDGRDETNSGFEVNQATFEEGSQISADVQSITGAEGSYTVLVADTITGVPDLEFEGEELPLLFIGELQTSDTEITLDLRRKTADELGLTQPQSQAYDAIIDAASETSLIEDSFLEVEDVEQLKDQFEGLLPDYSGGTFDFVTRSSRHMSRHISDADGIFEVSPVGGWLEPIYFQGSKNTGETAAFSNSGFGIHGGLERDFGFGYLGIGVGYVGGDVTNTDRQEITSTLLEVSAHWRLQSGGFNAYARVSGTQSQFSSTRTFIGEVDDTERGYTTFAEWDAYGFSGMAGLSYSFDLSRFVSLRPKAEVDYFWLDEAGYQEEGAEEIDLLVEDRTSSAATGTFSLQGSYATGTKRRDYIPVTFELEAGYRTILVDKLGETTASFLDADPFTITPEALSDGWMSEARIKAGGLDYVWQLAIGAEQLQGDIDMSGRISLKVAF